MPSSILLLDPYRSALLTMGLMEGILASPRGVDFKQSSTYLLGKNADRQSTVLRLAMLFDEVSIVSHEQRGVAEEYNAQGLPTLSTMPLQDMGLIRLTNRDITHPWEGAVLAGRSLGGIWQAIKGDLEPWEPLIVPYLVGKSVVPHASVYRYVKETRIGDENSVGEALEQIPQEFVTDAISLGNPTAGLTDLDLVVFATLNELLEAEAEVAATKCAVAHLPFGTVARDSGRATVESAQQILEVVVYELSVNGLVFPIPATLAELQKIRTTPAMQAFRSTFQPWIDALSQGQLADKRVLRAEVAAASRAFRNYPRIEAFSNFLMYISLPASFIPDPIIGLILGLGLGIAGIGLPKLAERWRQRSSWLSLCQKTGNSARL